jgi:hypothetical protein
MPFDEFWPWIVGGLAILVVFKAGMQFSENERARKLQEEGQRDIDLGVLAPILANFATGNIDRKQADESVRSATIFQPSAETLWFTMPESERERLGKLAIQMYGDPNFIAKEKELLRQAFKDDPELLEIMRNSVDKASVEPPLA